MFFTQEDYRKIEKWLLANSRKDTDFAGAATPLKGNETVVLVQNGKNVKASVKDVVEQLFLLGVSDFVNITDKYGESYISLSQAIELIPYRSRKIGQVVTFLDDTGKWAMFQFQGTRKNQWGTLSLWVDLIDLMTGLTITDSEDIVTETNSANQVALKFADKTYNEADYSGLGRVYLRKNIVNVEDPVTGNVVKMNYLTQSMISKENTIYIVQYSYNLNGQTITIPSGCVLLFEGGSIDNGSINFTDTTLAGDPNITTSISGTLKNSTLKPEWFGAKGDGVTEDSNAFQNCLNLKPYKVILTSNYLVKNVTIFGNISFIGVGNPSIIAIKQGGCRDVAEQIFKSTLSIDYVEFHNIYFNGNYTNPTIGATEGTAISNIFIDNCDKVVIDNCIISKFVASYNYVSTPVLKDRIYPAVFCIRNYKETIISKNEITDNPDKEVIYLLAKDSKSKATIYNNYCHDNLKSYSSFYIFDGSAHIYNNKIGDCRTSALGCICRNSVIENNYIYNYQRRGINCAESMIQADNTIIRGNTLTNKGYISEDEITEVVQGIVIYGSNITIESNNIDGAYTGIYNWEATDITYTANNSWLDSNYRDFYNLNISNNIVEAVVNPIKGRNRTMSQTGYDYDVRWYNINIVNNILKVSSPTKSIAGSSIYFDNIESVLISENNFNGWGRAQGGILTSQPGAISSEYYVKDITISNNVFNSAGVITTYFSFINAIQQAESINGISVINNSDNYNMASNNVVIRIIPNVPVIDFIIYKSDKSVGSSIIDSIPEITRKVINGLIYIKRISQQKRYNGLRIFDTEINQICIWDNDDWRNEDGTLVAKVTII